MTHLWTVLGVFISMCTLAYVILRNNRKDKNEEWEEAMEKKLNASECARKSEQTDGALRRMGKEIDQHSEYHDEHFKRNNRMEKYLIYLVQKSGGDPEGLLNS